MALNLAIRTRAKPGSRILLSDQEHNATFRVVHALKEAGLVEYEFFSSLDCNEAELERHLLPDTDILVCNLTSNVTGNTVPLTPLLSVARRHGLYLILDASQWLGHHIVPREICEADAVCAPGHKALYGIQGSGFVYLKNADGLPPFLYGGSGMNSQSPNMPKNAPERFEAGTLSTPAIVSLGAGIQYIEQIGSPDIIAHESALVCRCREILLHFSGVRVYCREDGGGSLLSFSHERLTSEHLADALDRYAICVRGGFHCAPLAHESQIGNRSGAVRISFGLSNTEKELDALFVALKEILK
jgi:selenocysteine lyase/cysteine desulfurase